MNNTAQDIAPLLSPFDNFTPVQVKFVSVASKVPALLSLWGSIFIIYDIIGTEHSRTKRLKNAYHRMMLGLSISDCIFSFFAWFLSTWPQPKDTIHSNFLWGNVGNDATCDAQGFMTQMGGISSIYYTAVLSLYYLLFVKYSWKEKDFQKIEPFLHFAVIGFAIASATTLLVKGLFNPAMPMCYINRYPFWCDGEECIRGANDHIFEYALFITPVAIALLVIVISMSTLVVHAWIQESKIRRLSKPSLQQTDRRNRLTKIVFKRALRYVGAYILTWLPGVAFTMTVLAAESKENFNSDAIFVLAAFTCIITPLNGLFNAMIYTESTISSLLKKMKARLTNESIVSTASGF